MLHARRRGLLRAERPPAGVATLSVEYTKYIRWTVKVRTRGWPCNCLARRQQQWWSFRQGGRKNNQLKITLTHASPSLCCSDDVLSARKHQHNYTFRLWHTLHRFVSSMSTYGSSYGYQDGRSGVGAGERLSQLQ